jgi:hypothetical protein
MKKDGSTNIQKSLLAGRKISQSTVKKWPFALLLLTNPLSYTIINNISMGVVAISGLLPLTLGRQRVIIMVISMIWMFLDFACQKFEISKSMPAPCKISKTKLRRFDTPWETASFLLLHTMYAISFHSNTASLLEYTKDNY